MKKSGNILKYPIAFVVYVVIFVALDKLFGSNIEKGFWYYCIQGLAFATALGLVEVAEKYGWDTWSGLISKFKKKKN